MKNKKHLKGKRILALLLSAMFIIPYVAVPALAAENVQTPPAVSTNEGSGDDNTQGADTSADIGETTANENEAQGSADTPENPKQNNGETKPQPEDKQNEQSQSGETQAPGNTPEKKKYSIEEFKEFYELFRKLEEERIKKQQGQKKNKLVIANGSYKIETECLKEEDDALSMANEMFSKEADLIVDGENTTLKIYVAYPVPAFPDLGKDCTLRDFYVKYGDKKYYAESDTTTKPKKPMRKTNPGFGLKEGEAISTQVLTIKMPTSAFIAKEVIFNAGCYVNVMMNRDAELRLKLTKIPADESAMSPLFMIDGKEVMVPNWLVGMMKSGKLLGGSNNNQTTGNTNKQATTTTSTNNSTTLADGVYSVNGNILKANGSGNSMANDAIDHTMYITVKNGKANLIVTFKGLAMNGSFGYLGYLNYYETMSSDTPYKSEVLSMQTSNGTVISDTYGTNYPKDIMFPLPAEGMNTGKISIQVFVPIMESISAGNGTQKAIIEIAVNNLQKVGDNADSFIASKKGTTVSTNNNQNTNTSELKLNDGIYKINVSMIKTDKTSQSMANNSINHIAMLKVEGGKYYLTLRFNPMNVGGKMGYLGKLKYYTPSYTLNNGDITGSLSDAKVEEYHTQNGKNVSDSYGTDYPKACTVEVIESARKDGFVALNVFVPIMDKISPGAGSQNVFAKLDIASAKQTTVADTDFTKEDSVPTASGENINNAANADELIGDTAGASYDELLADEAAPRVMTERVVTQYVSVPSGGTSSNMSTVSATDNYGQVGYYGMPNQYYNPYMMPYNPYYNPYAYYQNPYAMNYQAQNMNNKKGVAGIGTAASIIFGGVSGLGAALGYIFKRLL